jgi:uncharacterized protein YkwD
MAASGPEPASEAAPVIPSIAAASVRTGAAPPAQGNHQHALFEIVNETRTRAGVPPLAWDDKLAQAAWDHARVMADHGSLSHQFAGEAPLLERLAARQARLDSASENVVYDISVQGVHDNFMSSPAHRNNLLNPAYDAVGIAVVEAGGILYVVEDFAHRLPDVPDEDAGKLVADSFAQLRRAAGSEELPLVQDLRLNEIAQAMAQRETPDSKPALALPGARLAASYATANPDQLPATVGRLSAIRGLTHYGIGVCYARTPKYPGGLYWVTIVLFNSPELHLARR